MKYFLWSLISLSLFACKNPQSPSVADLQKPDSLIPRRKMIMILTDVHLTEAALSYIKTKGETPKRLTSDYYNAVFSKYKISQKNFESNFDYYKRNQEELLMIYEEVIKNLEILNKQGQPKKNESLQKRSP
jgi:hypothetical protein